jgi:hypothetical protein
MIYCNYAETYIEELKNWKVEPMFDLPTVIKKHLNLDTYVEKHLGKRQYALEDDLGVCIMNSKKQVKAFKMFTIESSWDDFKGNICLKIPNMRSGKAEALAFIREVFNRKEEGQEIFGLNVSSNQLIINFPFDHISVNPQQTARFKEVIFPNGKRLDTKDWRKILKFTGMINEMGYETTDLHNADYSTLVNFNIESYLRMVNNRDNIDNGKIMNKKPPKNTKKKRENVVSLMNDPEKVIEISKKGVEAREVRENLPTLQNCDNCAISDKCIDRVKGSVCIRKKKWKELAVKFKTRDLEVIYDGMTDVLSKQGERYARGVDMEEVGGYLSNDVTSVGNSLIKESRELIGLIKNPSGIKINITGNINETMEELNDQLTGIQRKELGEAIGGILKERRHQAARDGSMVTKES